MSIQALEEFITLYNLKILELEAAYDKGVSEDVPYVKLMSIKGHIEFLKSEIVTEKNKYSIFNVGSLRGKA